LEFLSGYFKEQQVKGEFVIVVEGRTGKNESGVADD
jgi:16S rRNA C1402 (ribose-2'-O) methylase RsmI